MATDPNASPSSPSTSSAEDHQEGSSHQPFSTDISAYDGVPDSEAETLTTREAVEKVATNYLARQLPSGLLAGRPPHPSAPTHPALSLITLVAIAITLLGLALDNRWMMLSGSLVALLVSLRAIWPSIRETWAEFVPSQQQVQLVAILGILAAIAGLTRATGGTRPINRWLHWINWEIVGALGDFIGALGQILIAVVAVYIAWRQYVISKDLTIQQNLLTIQQNIITQQQTIDTYFQGVSDLVLDDEGLLEDWPQERAIAEGRTAAILSSVDASGKAKIIRFLSKSRLLTPLKRDLRLGRAILDGAGGYAEDRNYGVRVIDLGVMLAKADLAGTDLRWTDLSEVNLVRADLSRCDLVKTNLSRTILYDAKLVGADLKAARLFYGTAEHASPRGRAEQPDYKTGAYTGAVIENANLSNVQSLSPEQHYYCCAWGGSRTRATIPGGCDGIPNKLGR